MKNNKLMLEDEIKKSIQKVITFAFKHPFTKKKIIKLLQGQLESPSENPNFTVEFDDYKLMFSVEEHASSFYRHLSVSRNETLATIPIVEQFLQEFGFGIKCTIMDMDNVWIEKDHSIHVIKRIEKNESPEISQHI
jgi:hypothetical protein